MSGFRVVIVECDYTTPEPRDDAIYSRVIVGYLLIVTALYTDTYLYTHQLEGLAVATLCGFESRLPHQQLTDILAVRKLSSCQVCCQDIARSWVLPGCGCLGDVPSGVIRCSVSSFNPVHLRVEKGKKTGRPERKLRGWVGRLVA